eukprot:1556177-Rhodomonas_salina.1
MSGAEEWPNCMKFGRALRSRQPPFPTIGVSGRASSHARPRSARRTEAHRRAAPAPCMPVPLWSPQLQLDLNFTPGSTAASQPRAADLVNPTKPTKPAKPEP